MRHIYLIGARACGKTTLGKLLADRLDLPYTDMDKAVEKKLGRSIAAFVSAHGWQAFRDMETQTLRELNAASPGVVATGGGVVLSEENRAMLSAGGVVFYLRADAATLCHRLQKDPLPDQRPALSDLPPLLELENTLKERDPLYTACAHHILDAAAPLDQVLDTALRALNTPHGVNE